MWGSEYYQNPEKYDGYRFLRMRETPGEDKNTRLVSTSSSHLGFGHGLHACPGRFFAANDIKIALCHLLLKYDWRLPDGFYPKPVNYGMTFLTDPGTTLFLRRRKEEIDFETSVSSPAIPSESARQMIGKDTIRDFANDRA